MTYDDLREKHGDILSDRFSFFRCDDEWLQLVDETLEELRRISPTARVTVVKEKFGRLVIYVEDKADLRVREFLREVQIRTAPPEERL